MGRILLSASPLEPDIEEPEPSGEGGGEYEIEIPPPLQVARVFMKHLPDGPEILISTQSKFSAVINDNIAIIVEWGNVVYKRLYLRVVVPTSGETGGTVRVGGDATNVSMFDGAVASGNFEQNRNYTAIALPSNGYRFAGWYADDEFATLVSTDAVYSASIGTENVTLYAKFERESVALYKWEGSTERKQMCWQSKVYALSKPANLTSVKIDATGYPIERFKSQSFSSPDTAATSTVDLHTAGSRIASQQMRRLPAKRPERFFQVEVENNAEIDAITIGTSGEGLAQ